MTTKKRYPKKANWMKNLSPEQLAVRKEKMRVGRDDYNARVRAALQALEAQS